MAKTGYTCALIQAAILLIDRLSFFYLTFGCLRFKIPCKLVKFYCELLKREKGDLGMKFGIGTELFWVFFKVGMFTFGGGYAMLPLIQKEVVESKKWVCEEEIVDIFAIAQSTPGIIAVNTAVFIGKKIAGIPGAVAGALGVILPAFIAIILVLLFLQGVQEHPLTAKVMAGIRAASAALILLAALKIGKSVLKSRGRYIGALLAFVAIIIFDINAAWVVVAGGLAGYLGYRFRKEER